MIALGGPTLKLKNPRCCAESTAGLNDSTGRAYTETSLRSKMPPRSLVSMIALGGPTLKLSLTHSQGRQRRRLNDSTGRAYTET